jgi:hypothetical protein
VTWSGNQGRETGTVEASNDTLAYNSHAVAAGAATVEPHQRSHERSTHGQAAVIAVTSVATHARCPHRAAACDVQRQPPAPPPLPPPQQSNYALPLSQYACPSSNDAVAPGVAAGEEPPDAPAPPAALAREGRGSQAGCCTAAGASAVALTRTMARLLETSPPHSTHAGQRGVGVAVPPEPIGGTRCAMHNGQVKPRSTARAASTPSGSRKQSTCTHSPQQRQRTSRQSSSSRPPPQTAQNATADDAIGGQTERILAGPEIALPVAWDSISRSGAWSGILVCARRHHEPDCANAAAEGVTKHRRGRWNPNCAALWIPTHCASCRSSCFVWKVMMGVMGSPHAAIARKTDFSLVLPMQGAMEAARPLSQLSSGRWASRSWTRASSRSRRRCCIRK